MPATLQLLSGRAVDIPAMTCRASDTACKAASVIASSLSSCTIWREQNHANHQHPSHMAAWSWPSFFAGATAGFFSSSLLSLSLGGSIPTLALCAPATGGQLPCEVCPTQPLSLYSSLLAQSGTRLMHNAIKGRLKGCSGWLVALRLVRCNAAGEHADQRQRYASGVLILGFC